MPIVGGRRVPLALAIVPGSLMSVLITNAGLMYWRLTLSGGFEIGGITLTLAVAGVGNGPRFRNRCLLPPQARTLCTLWSRSLLPGDASDDESGCTWPT
jgi:hypothetical protein